MKHSKLLALGLSAALCMGAMTSCSSGSDPIRFTGYAMGTVVNETLYTDGDDITTKIEAAIASLENTYLSNKVNKAEISVINANAGNGESSLSSELSGYLNTLLEVCENSGGAFDPSIGALSTLWDFDNDIEKVPADSDIKSLLAGTGYQKISITDSGITIPSGMKLDLGAAGKGIALDVAASMLADDPSVKGAVISVGESSILTYGENPNRDYWEIELRDPRDKEATIGSIKVSGTKYIGTSGDYQKYFEKDGVRYHHILDPSTGYPADTDVASVTIIADSGILCDALSTACFVLGTDEGMKLAEQYGVEAVFIDKDKNISMTSGAKELWTGR